MFLEITANREKRKGWIEVITGSMFSGKTEELLRRMRRAQFAKQKVEIFKPAVDTRYSDDKVVSHDANAIQSTVIDNAQQMLILANDVDVVGIDEAQFFTDEIIETCEQLAESGVRVIVAGLDMDYKGKPFGPMPQLLARAEYVTKVHAICVRCGSLAQFSHRTSAEEDTIILGETDRYEPLCRKCYREAIQQKNKS
jgi:thymidine kinase